VIGALLHNASVALLQHSMEQTEAERVRRIHRFGQRHDPLIDDHAFIHHRLETFLNSERAALV
jgi:hypothetical protein